MNVEVGELNSEVRAVDCESLLTPEVLDRIVRIVLEEIQERTEHKERVRTERRITAGVSYEMEEEDFER